MTQKQHFEMILEKLNIKEYFDKGYKGQNIKVASIESLTSDHGRNVYLTLKTYAPLCDIYSFNDEFGISATGDQGTPETINFPKFVDWCIDKKIDIVTSSLNWQADKEVEKEAIKKLYDNGIIFFNCTPNKDTTVTIGESDRACCIDKEVVGVSGLSLNIKGKLTWCDFANGNAVDVVGISENLPILYDADKFTSWSGNSAGTPLIASMLAVLKSSGFHVDNKNVMDVIKEYSEPFKLEKMVDKKTETHIYNRFAMPLLMSFTDTEEKQIETPTVSSWSEKSIKNMVELGITDGTRLKDNITREEVIVMMDRLYNKIKEET